MACRSALLVALPALVGVVTAHASTASAALIALDLFTAGDGLITRDTETNLDWLDVTATVNLSYTDIEADVGGWISLAFRHASGAEVCGLFAAYAQAPTPCPMNNPVFNIDGNLVQSLQGFVGVTFSARGINSSQGLFDDGDASNSVGFANLQYDPLGSSSSVRQDIRLATQATGTTGHWLVRPVPEPSTALLLAAGLVVFAVRRR